MTVLTAPAAFVRSDFSLESVLDDAGVVADRLLQLFLMNAGITDTTAKARFDPDCTWKGNIRSRDRFGSGSFLFR